MNELTPREQESAGRIFAPRRRVSWGAIWAGMFVTIIMLLMLWLLGLAVGIASLNPLARAAAGHGGMSIGADVWLMISWLVSVAVGARVGGWMSGGPRRTDGTMHGLVIWSFSAAVLLLLLSGAVGTLLGAAAGGQAMAAGNNTLAPGGAGQSQGNAMAPTGPSGGQPYSYSGGAGPNAGAGQETGGGAGAAQPFWGASLFSFLALILGLGVAVWSGGAGAKATESPLNPSAA